MDIKGLAKLKLCVMDYADGTLPECWVTATQH